MSVHAAQAAQWRWHGGHRIEYEQFRTAAGLRVLLMSDPALGRAEMTVHVPYGSYDEGEAYPGLAHLREHLVAFDRAPGEDQAVVPWVRKQYAGEHWFKTRDRDTLYFAAVETEQMAALWRRLRAALAPRDYSPDATAQQIGVIDGEWQRFRGQDGQILEQLEAQAADRRHPVSRFRSGSMQSLPPGHVDAIADAASVLSRHQHVEARMSLVVVAPLSLPAISARLGFLPDDRRPLREPASAAAGELATPPQPAGAVWSEEASGRLLKPSDEAGDVSLWWLWAPALGVHADRLHGLAEYMQADEPGSLANRLKGAGLITQLSAEAWPGYYGERDRFSLRLDLTEAGRRQLPALRALLWRAVRSWAEGDRGWRTAHVDFLKRRSAARAQQLPSTRAPASFELAHALAHCAGPRVFSGCEPQGGASPTAGLEAAVAWRDTVSWLLPSATSDRQAWARAQADLTGPSWSDWPAVPTADDGGQGPPVSPLPLARPRRLPQSVQTCRVPADPAQPWEGLAGATIDLQGLPSATAVQMVLRADHAVRHLATLRRYAAQEGRAPEWSLQGTQLQLTLTGRRQGQEAALAAWLAALVSPADPDPACCRMSEASPAARRRLAGWPGEQTYDYLRIALRQASGLPVLDPRAGLADPARGEELPTQPRLEASRLRLFLTMAPGASARPCEKGAQEARPAALPSGLHRVPVPAHQEHSALLQRCEAVGFDRFWQLRRWRPLLQKALLRVASEGGDALDFVSAPAFLMGEQQCWGISADSRTLQGDALVDAAQSRLRAGLHRLAQDLVAHGQRKSVVPAVDACSLAGAWLWWSQGQVLPVDWRRRCARALAAPEGDGLRVFLPESVEGPDWSGWVNGPR